MSNLRERVEQLWSTNSSEQMKMMRILRSEGYKPSEILQEVQSLRSGGVRQVKKVTVINRRLVGCQKDDDGNVVDPFTLELIADEDVVSYESSGGQRFCFDRRSLYRQYLIEDRKPLSNPFTRELLPSSLQQEVIGYGESLRTTILIDSRKFVVEPFTTVGELIVTYFMSLGSDYLPMISTTNLLHGKENLYATDLKMDAQKLNDEIYTRLFSSDQQRDEMLTALFQFVSTLRSRPVYNTIALYLGELLQVVPIVPKEDGFDLELRSDMTVLDVVKAFYAALAAKFGENVYRKYDIVTDYGDSLYDYDLYESISSQLPGENLHYVPYKSEEDGLNGAHLYLLEAFYENDQGLINAINNGLDLPLLPEPGATEINYTVHTLLDYMVSLIEKDDLDFDKGLDVIMSYILYEHVKMSLVYHVMKKAIKLNSLPNLRMLIAIFRDIEGYDTRSALALFNLSGMQEEMRDFVAEYLAGEDGVVVARSFYEDKKVDVENIDTMIGLDDVPIFHSFIKLFVVQGDVIEMICERVTKRSPKLFRFVIENVEARYTWKTLLGVITAEKYKNVLYRLSNNQINDAMTNPKWLGAVSGRKYFLDCLKVLLERIDDEHLTLIDWVQCVDIFYIEGVIEVIPRPFDAAYKVCAENDVFVAEFIPFLTGIEAQILLGRYPTAQSFEVALSAGVTVELPQVGTKARTNLVADVCDGDYELLLQLLVLKHEDTDLALQIILDDKLYIHRKTASYLIGGCTYEDSIPLLDEYFREQLEFGILPIEYFRRYIREYESEAILSILTDEQRRRIM